VNAGVWTSGEVSARAPGSPGARRSRVSVSCRDDRASRYHPIRCPYGSAAPFAGRSTRVGDARLHRTYCAGPGRHYLIGRECAPPCLDRRHRRIGTQMNKPHPTTKPYWTKKDCEFVAHTIAIVKASSTSTNSLFDLHRSVSVPSAPSRSPGARAEGSCRPEDGSGSLSAIIRVHFT
jgi:hypothetical protein